MVKEQLLVWLVSWGSLFDGLVGVLTFGFIRPDAKLFFAKKLAKWRWENRD